MTLKDICFFGGFCFRPFFVTIALLFVVGISVFWGFDTCQKQKTMKKPEQGEKGRHARKQKQKKQLAICNCFLISINEKLEVPTSYFSLFLLFFCGFWFLHCFCVFPTIDKFKNFAIDKFEQIQNLKNSLTPHPDDF